jgi:hypothetical protein
MTGVPLWQRLNLFNRLSAFFCHVSRFTCMQALQPIARRLAAGDSIYVYIHANQGGDVDGGEQDERCERRG